jgi:hypothetical protein
LVVATTVGLPAVHSARGTDDHLLLYGEGLRAFDFEKWEEAVMLLSAAAELQPVEGEWVRLYGMRWEPYLPYYHRAVALARLGRYSSAVEEIEESLRQGAISEKKNKRWLERMLELREEIGEQARERAVELIEDASAAQERLAGLQEQGGTAAEELAVVASSLATSQAEMAQGSSTPDAVASLEESVAEAWRELAAAAEEERRAREAARREQLNALAERYGHDLDEARVLASPPGCQREAIDRLEGLQDAPDPARPGDAALLLARELAECGEYDLAHQFLSIARAAEMLDERELAGELERVRVAEAASVLAELQAAITPAECQPRRLQALPEYVERGLLSHEWQALLQATGMVACGEIGPARESLASAEELGAPAAALAPIRQAIEREEAELEALRRTEALLERVRALRDRLAAESCVPEAAVELAALLGDDPPAPGAAESAPAVLLATEYLECGDHRAALAALDGAADEVRTSPEGAALGDRIRTLEAERQAHLLRLRTAGSYAEADARVRLGECDPRIFEILDATEASMADDPELLARLEVAVRPLPLVRGLALMNCGRRDDAARLVEAMPVLDEVAASQALRRWLQAERALEQYTGSYALLIGMSEYGPRTGWARLPGVREDIEAVGEVLEAHGFTVERAFDLAAADFDARMRKFIADHGLEADKRLVVYYAGHGWTESNLGIQLGYVVPVDAPTPIEDKTALLSLVSMNSFEVYAKEMRARHVAFFFDSCFSGTVFDATKSLLASETELSNVANLREPVRLFVTAGDAEQQVPDESAFRRAFVTALAGGADANTDGLILGSELGSFVRSTGASALNTPQWGRINHPSFDHGDLGFRSPSVEAGHLAPASERARLQAELQEWASVIGAGGLEGTEEFVERYPAGSISRGLSALQGGG